MSQKHIDSRIRAAKMTARVIIAESRRERDATGYRENLAYDRRPELMDCINLLVLPYAEECQILAEFDAACDSL